MKRHTTFDIRYILLSCLMMLLNGGCIRLMGGAAYVKKTPDETVTKSYVVDTGEFVKGRRTPNITY